MQSESLYILSNEKKIRDLKNGQFKIDIGPLGRKMQ